MFNFPTLAVRIFSSWFLVDLNRCRFIYYSLSSLRSLISSFWSNFSLAKSFTLSLSHFWLFEPCICWSLATNSITIVYILAGFSPSLYLIFYLSLSLPLFIFKIFNFQSETRAYSISLRILEETNASISIVAWQNYAEAI